MKSMVQTIIVASLFFTYNTTNLLSMQGTDTKTAAAKPSGLTIALEEHKKPTLSIHALAQNGPYVHLRIAVEGMNSQEINAQDYQHRTALHYAAMRGFPTRVRLLLRHGSNPNQGDDRGYTPLIDTIAQAFICNNPKCRAQYLECIRLLVLNGAVMPHNLATVGTIGEALPKGDESIACCIENAQTDRAERIVRCTEEFSKIIAQEHPTYSQREVAEQARYQAEHTFFDTLIEV